MPPNGARPGLAPASSSAVAGARSCPACYLPSRRRLLRHCSVRHRLHVRRAGVERLDALSMLRDSALLSCERMAASARPEYHASGSIAATPVSADKLKTSMTKLERRADAMIPRRLRAKPDGVGQSLQMRLARSLTNSLSDVLLNGRLRAYLDILVVGSGARMFGLVSQFVVLIMLSRFLSKDSFGNLMTAFGFYRLAGLALGVGGSLVLLFHVSRHRDDRQAEIRLQRFSALIGAIPSALVALITIWAAHPVAAALGKPSLEIWLEQLAPFVIFTTLLIITTGALEGRSRVAASIFWGEAAPNAVRIVLLPLVVVLHLPETYVAHVLTLSVLLPWLWLARRLWDRSVRGVQLWSGWDYTYCGKFVVATLFANQLGAADIVIASVLFSSATVADYAVAARLAALFSFFQLALLKRFAPRAGQLLHLKDQGALHREFELCRRLAIGCGAWTISGVLLLAPALLPLLGNYMGARALLIWLAIPCFVQSFYATSDRLLIIAGQANAPLVVTAASFVVLIASPFATAAWFGPASIPVAMTISVVLFSPLIAVRVRQLAGLATIATWDGALMACGCIALAASAIAVSYASAAIACGVLAVIGGYYGIAALSRPAADDYDNSLVLRPAASSANPSHSAPDKASR
jgi:O-antigen/teichoic acid export membrane protein